MKQNLFAILFGAIGGIALLFSACSESGTTEKIVEVVSSGMEIVTDVSLLPKCEKANDGELVWVKNETTPRMCSDGLWYAIAEGSVAATCSTKPLLDGSGLKVVCGGDSVGVLLNGKDGKDGELGLPGETVDKVNPGNEGADTSGGSAGKDGKNGKNGVGCTMETLDEFSVRIVCGTDSTILYMKEMPDTAIQGGGILDTEKIAISLDQVSGVTQKGPFLSGSKVIVHEMNDGRTLTQTGNSFNGKILNDKGEFKINARTLVSQYVLLEATGYYRNEITDKNSSSELTLFAIADVSNRDIVNVNLLTHLEYERVVYLVTQEKMKVKAAKKQAQKEIFDLLHIDASKFRNSEDMNIAGASDADAALLAFSIILQGNRNVVELSELLQKIAFDIEKDGVWDDAATRLQLAEWTALADLGRYNEICRECKCPTSDCYNPLTFNRNVIQIIKNWGILNSDTVPNFAKYVNQFWSAEFGLGPCDAGHLGVVAAATKGSQKGTDTRYVCLEDIFLSQNTSEKTIYEIYYAWRKVVDDYDKDTYGWSDTTDGALKKGDVSGKIYVFDSLAKVYEGKGWQEASGVEKIWGGCTESLLGTYKRCDISNGCDQNTGYHKCVEWDYRTRYWQHVEESEMTKIETGGWMDAEDGTARWSDSSWTNNNVNGVVEYYQFRNCYVYDTSAAYRGWRKSLDYNYDYSPRNRDCTLGLGGCTVGRLGQIYKAADGDYYECSTWSSNQYYSWNTVTDHIRINTLGWNCLDSNDGEMRKGLENDSYFVCENGAWRDATTSEERNCIINGVCN